MIDKNIRNYEQKLRRQSNRETPRIKRRCNGGPYDGHWLRLADGEQRSALIKVGDSEGRYVRGSSNTFDWKEE
jgi:hypothetical protein